MICDKIYNIYLRSEEGSEAVSTWPAFLLILLLYQQIFVSVLKPLKLTKLRMSVGFHFLDQLLELTVNGSLAK